MVGLIFCGDLKYCPYIKRYIERIEKKNIDYKVYFWNRSNFSLNLPENYIYFEKYSKLSKSKINKLYDFILFRNWIKKKIKKDKPSHIIVLSTLSGIILGKTLYSNPGKYIFDIRDYSYEHIAPFYFIEKKIIYNSYFTAISSKGFKSFLPKYDYVIAHNFNRNEIIKDIAFKKTSEKIKLVWNGVIRYFDYQKQYLDALKNDERFEIIFHGDGPELKKYKKYCEENNFNNVVFTGAYDNANKLKLLRDANIINNSYGSTKNSSIELKYAVSNRFYDAINFHIPQLVEAEGYKTDWVKEANIGINYNADKNFADKLFDYYQNINVDKFNKACDNVLNKILMEDNKFIESIDKFIN